MILSYSVLILISFTLLVINIIIFPFSILLTILVQGLMGRSPVGAAIPIFHLLFTFICFPVAWILSVKAFNLVVRKKKFYEINRLIVTVVSGFITFLVIPTYIFGSDFILSLISEDNLVLVIAVGLVILLFVALFANRGKRT